jgi:pyruvyltransferase
MADPVKLYWWKDKPNFGDALSQGVVSHVLGRPAHWTSEANCQMFAIGSILHRANAIPLREVKPIVWGSGHTKPVNPDILDRLDIIAVRGPITASYLNIRSIAMGDPGLFAAELLPDVAQKKYRVGVIPNHHQTRYFRKLALPQDDTAILINPATRDYLSVVRLISECEFILSSSLHGLVVADSLGIPNQWIDPFGIADAARLKYYDYALSIGRILGEPVPVQSIKDAAQACLGPFNAELPYSEGIAASKAGLLDALNSSRLSP